MTDDIYNDGWEYACSTFKCFETDKYIIVYQTKLGSSFITSHLTNIQLNREFIYNSVTNTLEVHPTNDVINTDVSQKNLVNTFNLILRGNSTKKLIFLYRNPEKRLLSCIKEDLYKQYYNDIDITDDMKLLLNNKSILLEEYESFLLDFHGDVANRQIDHMEQNSSFVKISKLLIDINLVKFWNKEYDFLKIFHNSDYLTDILRLLNNNLSNTKILLIDIDRHNFSKVLNMGETYSKIASSKHAKVNETPKWLGQYIFNSMKKSLEKNSNRHYYNSYMRTKNVLYSILVNSNFDYK